MGASRTTTLGWRGSRDAYARFVQQLCKAAVLRVLHEQKGLRQRGARAEDAHDVLGMDLLKRLGLVREREQGLLLRVRVAAARVAEHTRGHTLVGPPRAHHAAKAAAAREARTARTAHAADIISQLDVAQRHFARPRKE